MVGIPRPANFMQADTSIDSAAIVDDAVGAVDVANSLVHDMVAKTAPVGADAVLINDSEASNINKKATLTNVANMLAGTQASTGLTDATGVLTVSPSDNAITIGADSLVYMTATGLPKKDLASDVATAMAGEGIIATSGVLSLDLDEFGDAVLDPAADTLVFIDESAAGDPGKLESVADFVAAIGGSAATTGLSNTAGVLTAAIKIAHLVADEKSSLFFEGPTEVDFGVATAVDEKITDSAGAKGKLLIAIGIVTEAFNGDADNTISISNNTLLGANKMCSDIIVDKDAAAAGNWLGALFGGHRVAGADNTVASGNDIYAYSAANTNRSAGKMVFLLIFQKTA